MAGVKGKGGKKGRSGRKAKSVEGGLLAVLDIAWPMEKRIAWFRSLVDLSENSQDEKIRLSAGQELTNRYYGKSTEHHNVVGVQEIRVTYGDGSNAGD